jgi:hypothetical protein
LIPTPLERSAESASLIGEYLPTRRVLGEPLFAARSSQTMFSGGFCEVGVKNEATAFSKDFSDVL